METYENPWLYQGTTFTSDDINNFFGYVYLITNKITNRKYIGRKYFVQKRKPKGGKRRITSESDWNKYYGSSPELKEDVKKYGNVLKWARKINERKAVKRGIMVNKIKGKLSSQLHERHNSSDFIHNTQDKLEKSS